MTQQRAFQLYDTTLRDGMQQEGMALSVDDKLAVARHLAELGVGFIEGGWPGAIPRDTAFFRRARTELSLGGTQLVAFGATRRPDLKPWSDPQVFALLEAQTPVITLVAKSHPRHVTAALRTTLEENLSMVDSTVRYLIREGRRVFVDAEHFFDGYRADRRYALAVVEAAATAGAEVVVLCDTNGGALPDEIGEVVAATVATGVHVGIHCHDDTGCAVANSLVAVTAGADHVQATAHGYGERCGNANMFSLAANLAIKRGLPVLSTAQLETMSEVADAISRLTSFPGRPSAPYVGSGAFTHKAGLHAAALRVDPDLYQHIRPDRVGNAMRTLVSDQGGRSSIALKATELGWPVPTESLAQIAARIKELETAGYSFESADASFVLLLREELGGDGGTPFTAGLWSVAVVGEPDRPPWCVADVEFVVDNVRFPARGEGHTAVNALDTALHAALEPRFPALARMRFTGHDVRVLDNGAVRVRMSFVEGDRRWSTIAVDRDQVSAAWSALRDAATYALVCAERPALALVPAGTE